MALMTSCAAVVSHISSILRIAERLNKKREINTQEDRVSKRNVCNKYM